MPSIGRVGQCEVRGRASSGAENRRRSGREQAGQVVTVHPARLSGDEGNAGACQSPASVRVASSQTSAQRLHMRTSLARNHGQGRDGTSIEILLVEDSVVSSVLAAWASAGP